MSGFTFSATGADRGRRDSIIRGLKQLEKDYMLSYEEEIEWLNCLFPEVTWENSPKKVELVEKDLLEKACEWLQEDLYNTCDSLGNKNFESSEYYTVEEFIETFRKAMKDENSRRTI